jgi:hypothetical protein
MKEQFILVDNFYDEPYFHHRNCLDNKSIDTEEAIGKISQILGNSINVIESTINVEKKFSILSHLDSDWIAVIYLSLPLEIVGKYGITFYSHLKTKLKTFPSNQELEIYNIDIEKLDEIFKSDVKLWEEYAKIPLKYNRMVLFRGNMWHSYFKNEECESINICTLQQRLIIKNG